MSSKEDRIQARIEPELKQAAEIIFSKLGISSGEAIRMFYSQVKLRGGIPFNIRLPNADTIEAMEELNINGGEHFSSADELFKSWNQDE